MSRRNPRVLLVYPPNQLMSIETPRPDGSLGPLYLASALERAGFQTDVLDASVGTSVEGLKDTFYRSVMMPSGLIRIGMNQAEIAEYIAKGQYDVVGINSNFTPQTRMALEVAEAAKSVSRDILVLMGGVNGRNLRERVLRSGNVDAICLSEGEKIICRMVDRWVRSESVATLSGVATLRDDVVVSNPVMPGDVYDNLDSLPLPAWDKLAFPIYERLSSPHAVISSGKGRYAPIMTSRGCPFHCSYCHISVEKEHADGVGGIGSWRAKSITRVLEEIETLQGLGVSKLYFEDDSLLAQKERVRRLFREVTGRGLQIANVNGVNLVHLFIRRGDRLVVDIDYLELLKASGFDQIVFPVESASQRVLNKYATAKLHHDRISVIDLVTEAKKVGILCPINMMMGFPDETEEEIMSSIELGKRLVGAGSPYCTFFIPIPFPGSQLYDIAIKGGHLEPDFDTDTLNWKNAVMKNTTVPPERVLELRDYGWKFANTEEHVSARLKASIGGRWQSGE